MQHWYQTKRLWVWLISLSDPVDLPVLRTIWFNCGDTAKDSTLIRHVEGFQKTDDNTTGLTNATELQLLISAVYLLTDNNQEVSMAFSSTPKF